MKCLLFTSDGRLAFQADVASRFECFDVADSIDHSQWATMYTLEEPEDVAAAITTAIAAIPSGGESGSPPFPSAEDCAAAWGIGFVMVVGCYVIARSVGAVVNFIDKP